MISSPLMTVMVDAARKAGNVADWVRRFGGNYPQMQILDADSVMTGDTIVRLNQVATLTESTGTNQINRRAMLREIQITANVYGRTTGEVSGDIRTLLDKIAFPPGYGFTFGGATKNMQESFAYALQALAMAGALNDSAGPGRNTGLRWRSPGRAAPRSARSPGCAAAAALCPGRSSAA